MLGCGGCCPWEMLVWAAMADLLVFPFLSHLFNQFLNQCLFLLVVTADHFCGWVHRGPVDNVKDQPPSSSFLVFIGVAADHFSWRYFPYLLVNEERATLSHNHEALEICSLPWKYSLSAPWAPRQEKRENEASRGKFPLFSLNFFSNFLMLLQ